MRSHPVRRSPLPSRTVLHLGLGLVALCGCVDKGASGAATRVGESADTAAGAVDTADTADAWATGPIYTFFSAHGHAYGLPETAPAQPNFLDLKRSRYDAHHEQITWLADVSEGLGGRMSFNMNGEYARDARLLADDAAHFADLAARGHTISSHFHLNARLGDDEYWSSLPSQGLTEAELAEVYRQNLEEVIATLGGPIRRLDPGVPREEAWEKEALEAAIDAHGLDIIPSGESFTFGPWNHFPMNPFRRRAETECLEDFDGATVAIPSYAQLGQEETQGLHRVSGSVAQMQRHFVQLLATRHHAQVSGEVGRVWAIGMMTHPDSTARFQEDIEAWMTWIHTDVSTWTDASGAPVVAWVTDSELVDAFVDWERAHPEVSSFSFDAEAQAAGVEQDYPYALEPMIRALVASDFEAVLPLGAGVHGFRLRHRDLIETVHPGPMETVQVTLGEPEEALYLLWTDAGTATVDLGDELVTEVFVLDGASGAVEMGDPAALVIGTTPMVVAETDAVFK